MSMIDLSLNLSVAVAALQAGRGVIILGGEDRENEGDIVLAAEHATPEAINFMATHARGLICLALGAQQAEQLQLPMMTGRNAAASGSGFLVSIDARHGVTSGMSAGDRARTIQAAGVADAKPEDLVSPGHIFPLRAEVGGVLAKAGRTEAAVDMMRFAGLRAAAAICEILNPDGSLARLHQLREFGARHGLPIVTIGELVANMGRMDASNGALPVSDGEDAIIEIGKCRLPSGFAGSADLTAHALRDRRTGIEHLAIVKGKLGGETHPLVHVHSECVTGDAFGSLRCNCGPQLQSALRGISVSASGMVIYVRGHEGRGSGLADKICAYALRDLGLNTVESDHETGSAGEHRDWKVAARLLRHLGARNVNLLTDNPDEAACLSAHGIEVVRRVTLAVPGSPFRLPADIADIHSSVPVY